MDMNTLLRQSVEANASDLHLSSGMPPMMRVDGDLQKLDYPPCDEDTVLALKAPWQTTKKLPLKPTSKPITPMKSKAYRALGPTPFCNHVAQRRVPEYSHRDFIVGTNQCA